MKNFLKILIAIVIAGTVASCRKDLILDDLGDYNNVIVLNGLFYADSTGSVNIAKSIGLLDSENEQVILENATVTMVNENNSMFTFQYDSGGYYTFNEDRFVAGETYSVTVSNEGFSTVEASLTIPHKTTIESIDTSFSYGSSPNCIGCESGEILRIKMKLKSGTSQKEYIIISLFSLDSVYSSYYNGLEIVEYDSRLGKWYSDLYSHDQGLMLVKNDYYLEEVFDDGYYYSGNELFFEKPEGDVDYNINIIDYDFSVSDYSPIHYLSVTTVSEEYFKHQLSLARAYYAEDDFLAEKVSIFTNIENGMGILAGANQVIKEIDLSNHKH